MTTNNKPKKQQQDWHKADIIAELHKKGFSLRQLSLHNGLSPTTLRAALDRPYPKAENIIAKAIGLTVDDIWPQRQAQRNFIPKYPS